MTKAESFSTRPEGQSTCNQVSHFTPALNKSPANASVPATQVNSPKSQEGNPFHKMLPGRLANPLMAASGRNAPILGKGCRAPRLNFIILNRCCQEINREHTVRAPLEALRQAEQVATSGGSHAGATPDANLLLKCRRFPEVAASKGYLLVDLFKMFVCSFFGRCFLLLRSISCSPRSVASLSLRR